MLLKGPYPADLALFFDQPLFTQKVYAVSAVDFPNEMVVLDLYSKRQKRLRGEVPDIFSYDKLPDTLKMQIVYIWHQVLGDEENFRRDHIAQQSYKFIVDKLCEEHGYPHLCATSAGRLNHFDELIRYFLADGDVEEQLDAVELSFVYVNTLLPQQHYLNSHEKVSRDKAAKAAINKLNIRFKENGVGYQFINNRIVRVDSELLHVEAVKPALRLLSEPHYKGAQEEFLSAYDHYRHGNNKEALADCLKAFESVMKSICDKRKWSYNKTDTAKKLIRVCLDNGLVPSFWQNQLSALRSLLEGSIPTVRNKLGGHGQGSTPVNVEEHVVTYALHMTASTIVFFANSEKGI